MKKTTFFSYERIVKTQKKNVYVKNRYSKPDGAHSESKYLT